MNTVKQKRKVPKYLLALCMKYCVLVWAPLHKVLILNVTELEINNGAING